MIELIIRKGDTGKGYYWGCKFENPYINLYSDRRFDSPQEAEIDFKNFYSTLDSQQISMSKARD